MIAFRCSCGQGFKVEDSWAGRKARCKKCGKELVVPRATAAAPSVPPPPRPGAATPPAAPLAAGPHAKPAVAPSPAATPPPAPTAAPETDDLFSAMAEAAQQGQDEHRIVETPAPLPAPPQPSTPRPAPAVQSPSRTAMQAPLPAARPKPASGSGSSITLGRAIGSGIVLLLVLGWTGLKFYYRVVRPVSRVVQAVDTAESEEDSETSASPDRATRDSAEEAPAATGPISDERPKLSPYEGVLSGVMRLAGIGGVPQQVRIYLPSAATTRPASLPCVLVAPAGSNLAMGMALSEEDTIEHLPYVREGFAVVAYEIDGDLDDIDKLAVPHRRFVEADGGIISARRALTAALKAFPEIDPNRVYAAGHSSAATLALLLAAKEPRIRACVAYAPCCDVEGNFTAAQYRELDKLRPGAKEFMRSHSPLNLPPQCPVMVFHARGDEIASFQDSQTYVTKNSAKAELVAASGDDHFDTMIKQGIHMGVTWLQKRANIK